MNWLNIRTETVRSSEFSGSEPVERATWICVLAYCVEQENGGVIVGAKSWKCRQWQQTCGVTLKEILKSTRLFSWNENDLIVWNYPTEKEKEVVHKREVAKMNGKSGGRPVTNNEPTSEPTSVTERNQRPKAEGNGREVEGNKNGNGTHPKIPPTPKAPSSPNGVVEGKDSYVIPTTEQSKRFAAIFHRQITTPWNKNEVAAYKLLGKVTEEDLEAVEQYYAENWPPRRDTNILRHNLITFLNNWAGEVDRAKASKSKPKSSRSLEWSSTENFGPLPTQEEIDRARSVARDALDKFKASQNRS